MASTFGNLKKTIDQGEYTNKLKNKNMFCNKTLNQYVSNKKHLQNNKNNLIISQYSKLNLKDVCVVAENSNIISAERFFNVCNKDISVIITTNNIFYNNNFIDPLGQLFGKNKCGLLNYTKYIEY
jgi:hypothetical protein